MVGITRSQGIRYHHSLPLYPDSLFIVFPLFVCLAVIVPWPRAKELRLAAVAPDDLQVGHRSTDRSKRWNLRRDKPRPMPAPKCCYDLGEAHKHRAASIT